MNMKNFGYITIDVDEILSVHFLYCGSMVSANILYRSGVKETLYRESAEVCKAERDSFDQFKEWVTRAIEEMPVSGEVQIPR